MYLRLSGSTSISRASALYNALYKLYKQLSKSFLLVVIWLSVVQSGQASVLGSASQIVVFGDSASSTTWNGSEYRLTNDLVWAEYLGNSLGLQTSIYAVPGGYTADDSLQFSLFRQLDSYYADNSDAVDPNAVHFIFIGGNDAFSLQQSHLNRQQAMQDLIDRGASNIVLVNLPNPYRYSDSDLQTYVPAGVTVYDLMDVLLNLDAYGITDTTTPCQFNISACDYSMRWDTQGHPASGFHKAIAQHMEATLVPVPAAAWLFASAIAGLIGIRASVRGN